MKGGYGHRVLSAILVGIGLAASVSTIWMQAKAPPEPDLMPGGWADFEPLHPEIEVEAGDLRLAQSPKGVTMWSFQGSNPMPLDALATAFEVETPSEDAPDVWVVGAQAGRGVLLRVAPGTLDEEPRILARYEAPRTSVYTGGATAPAWLHETGPALLLFNSRYGRLEVVPLAGSPPAPQFDRARTVGRRVPGPILAREAVGFSMWQAPASPGRDLAMQSDVWQLDLTRRLPRSRMRPPRWVLRWRGDPDQGRFLWRHATAKTYADRGHRGPRPALGCQPGDAQVRVLVRAPDLRAANRFSVEVAPSATGPWRRLDVPDAEHVLLENTLRRGENRIELGITLDRALRPGEFIKVTHRWNRGRVPGTAGAPVPVVSDQPTPTVNWGRPDRNGLRDPEGRILVSGPNLTAATRIEVLGPRGVEEADWTLVDPGVIGVRVPRALTNATTLRLRFHTPGIPGDPVIVHVQNETRAE